MSGKAMAVLLGFAAIATASFFPQIDLGARVVLFLIGGGMIVLGAKS